MPRINVLQALILTAALGIPDVQAPAQVGHAIGRPLASNVIVPQSRAWATAALESMPPGRPAPVEITDVTVGVVIVEQAATTTMDIGLRNPGGSRVEAELVVPVPDGAVVRGFSFQGTADEPTAEVLPKDEARKTYEAIVARVRDPALLEFIGCNMIRSSVFPIAAGGTQKVRLTYEHLLPAEGDRIDYFLPRSESLSYRVPWKVSVKIESKRPISTVYSPSHKLETARSGEHVASVRIAPDAVTEPGPFRLSYLLEHNGITASLLAYPDAENGGGYFLLLAGLPARSAKTDDGPAIKREVTLVIDRSGSMRGEKIEQVREAAQQIIAGLEQGEAFNILIYNDTVDLFSKQPVLKTEANVRRASEYLKSITASGGTNIHDALTEALRLKPIDSTLPIVLFLTDGLPTVGQTSEVAIRNVAIKSNPHQRRVFTFGVGVDVNTPLLEKIAYETRSTPTFVLPSEDVEAKVGRVFKRLSGPVLADAMLEDLAKDSPRIREVMPAKLPDLFADDQLVVLGKYVGAEQLALGLQGNYLGQKRAFKFTFDLAKATTKNSFVPRLWASRKIAVLVDAIRQLGADGSPIPTTQKGADDPQVKELVDEIVRLGTEFGILTEYTAFLAREGTDLSNRDIVLAEANGNFFVRAMNTRSGLGAVNQGMNSKDMLGQDRLNPTNGMWDANMNRVSVANVQQINDLAFYNRNGRWVDSRVVNDESRIQPSRTIEFGSDEFLALARRLADEGRNGSLSLHGDVLLVVDGQPVLIKGAD